MVEVETADVSQNAAQLLNDTLVRTNDLLARIEPLVTAEEQRREELNQHKKDLERVIKNIQNVAADITVAPREGRGLRVDFKALGSQANESGSPDKAVEFTSGSADVPPGLELAVEKLANHLKDHGELTVTVVGYHDSETFDSKRKEDLTVYHAGVGSRGKGTCKGCLDSNLTLATMRAMNVAALILRAGVDNDRVRVQGRHDSSTRSVVLVITLHDLF